MHAAVESECVRSDVASHTALRTVAYACMLCYMQDWYRQGTTTISHGVDSISHAGPIEGVRETLGVGTHGGGSSGYTSAGQPQSAAGVMGTSGGGGPIKRDY